MYFAFYILAGLVFGRIVSPVKPAERDSDGRLVLPEKSGSGGAVNRGKRHHLPRGVPAKDASRRGVSEPEPAPDPTPEPTPEPKPDPSPDPAPELAPKSEPETPPETAAE